MFIFISQEIKIGADATKNTLLTDAGVMIIGGLKDLYFIRSEWNRLSNLKACKAAS